MAEKRPLKDDPVNMMKLMARNVLDGIFDDLMENNVLNRGELQRLGKEVNHIVNRTGDLVDDLTEKTQIAGKIFKDHFFNPKKQLSLRSHPEDESDESESTESSSSTESEDESEKSGDEEKVESAQTLALPPTGPKQVHYPRSYVAPSTYDFHTILHQPRNSLYSKGNVRMGM